MRNYLKITWKQKLVGLGIIGLGIIVGYFSGDELDNPSGMLALFGLFAFFGPRMRLD